MSHYTLLGPYIKWRSYRYHLRYFMATTLISLMVDNWKVQVPLMVWHIPHSMKKFSHVRKQLFTRGQSGHKHTYTVIKKKKKSMKMKINWREIFQCVRIPTCFPWPERGLRIRCRGFLWPTSVMSMLPSTIRLFSSNTRLATNVNI
jgi:hypothetical protein